MLAWRASARSRARCALDRPAIQRVAQEADDGALFDRVVVAVEARGLDQKGGDRNLPAREGVGVDGVRFHALFEIGDDLVEHGGGSWTSRDRRGVLTRSP